MNDIKMDRREFLKSTAAAAAVGAAGPSLFFSQNAMGAENGYDTIVLVFLRGGMDGLNFVVPTSGPSRTDYEINRPTLQIPLTGSYPALPLTLDTGAETGFGLHPAAAGLHGIWNAGKLAIVHSCGMLVSEINRSHFDTQLFLDLGTPGNLGTPGSKTTQQGWLTRAWLMQEALGATGAQMPLLTVGATGPKSILGSDAALSMASPASMSLNLGGGSWRAGVQDTVGSMWSGTSDLEDHGQNADAAMELIATQAYTAPPEGWPTDGFAAQLWTIAQSIRFNLGLRYATLDLGGWDTHDEQGTVAAPGAGRNYQTRLEMLSAGLTAFYNNLTADGTMGRVTVIVQSEFGRRVRENASGGTDHGYGNPLLVLGGPVVGRKFYGQWKGLSSGVLAPYFGDVPVTTDYRRVFSEILMRRMGNNKLGVIFPDYTYGGYMNIVTGTKMTPDYSPTIAGVSASLPDNPQPAYGTSLEPVTNVESTTRRGWLERIMASLGLAG